MQCVEHAEKLNILAKQTQTEVAAIHLMPTLECGIKSSATFGSEDSTLELLWKRNSLCKGTIDGKF